jgi:hypothetical protein
MIKFLAVILAILTGVVVMTVVGGSYAVLFFWGISIASNFGPLGLLFGIAFLVSVPFVTVSIVQAYIEHRGNIPGL